VSADGVKAIAAEAHARGGARLLSTIVEEVLRGVTLKLPEFESRGVKEVRLGKKLIASEARTCSRIVGRLSISKLKEQAFGLLLAARGEDSPEGHRNEMSEEQIRERTEELKNDLDWVNTTGSARKWWEAFEREKHHRPALVLRVVEELHKRKATVTEFFLAYIYSGIDDIQGNLSFLDFTRRKNRETKRKKQQQEIGADNERNDEDEGLGHDPTLPDGRIPFGQE